MLSKKWISWNEKTPAPFTAKDLSELSSLQIREFLAQLLEADPLTIVKLTAMQEAYDFSNVVNAEIRFR